MGALTNPPPPRGVRARFKDGVLLNPFWTTYSFEKVVKDRYWTGGPHAIILGSENFKAVRDSGGEYFLRRYRHRLVYNDQEWLEQVSDWLVHITETNRRLLSYSTCRIRKNQTLCDNDECDPHFSNGKRLAGRAMRMCLSISLALSPLLPQPTN
jgi:hypothetical protein